MAMADITTGTTREPERNAVTPLNAGGGRCRDKPTRSDPIAELAARGVHPDAGFRVGFSPIYDLRSGRLWSLSSGAVRLRDLQPIAERDGDCSIGSRDMPRIDQAMLLRSLTFSRTLADAGVTVPVWTSVSFETLTWSVGRQFFQNTLRATQCADNPLLIVAIDGIPSGTPYLRVAEHVASIRPHAKRVFARLPESGLSSIRGSSLGANGYACSVPPDMTPRGSSAFLVRFARLCALQGAFSCIDRVRDLATAKAVRTAGVRFAGGPFFGDTVYFDETPAEEIRAHHMGARDFMKMSSAR